LAKILLEKEILFQHDLLGILGNRPFDKISDELQSPIIEAEVIESTQNEATEETPVV
jgi:hypothetical protein